MNSSKIEIPECCKETKKPPQKIFTFKEKKSQLSLTNQHGTPTTKVKVDGCVFKDNQEKRCDYLLITNDWEIYIELKGRDYQSGVDQLKNTINKIGDKDKKKKAYLICTQSPSASVERQKIERKFQSEFGFKVIIKNTPAQDKY